MRTSFRLIILVFGVIFSSAFICRAEGNINREERLKADGPYIIYDEYGKTRYIQVNVNGEIIDTTYTFIPEDFSFTVTDQTEKYCFEVSLHKHITPEWKHKKRRKTFILSDPHGKMELMVELLKENHIIDKDLHWSYGKNHLVVLGDIFDRGDDVTQMLWLIYKLEYEAAKAGGTVSFLLGNHEAMVLAGDIRYIEDKYADLADTLNVTVPELYAANTELGKWISKKNTIEYIDDILLVHAGLSEDLIESGLSVAQINNLVRSGLYMDRKVRKTDPVLGQLFGSFGPIWYRGLVLNKEKYNPASPEVIEKILEYFNTSKIIIGHTIFDDITFLHNEQVIAVNVDNERNHDLGLSRAILLKGNRIKVIR